MITIASSLVDLTTRFREGEIVKMIKVRKLTKHKQRNTNDQQYKYKHRQKTHVRIIIPGAVRLTCSKADVGTSVKAAGSVVPGETF